MTTEQVAESVVVVVIGVKEHPVVVKDDVVLHPVVKTPPDIVVLKQYTIRSVTVTAEQEDEEEDAEPEEESEGEPDDEYEGFVAVGLGLVKLSGSGCGGNSGHYLKISTSQQSVTIGGIPVVEESHLQRHLGDGISQ